MLCPHRLFGFKDIVLYHNCSQPNALVLNASHPWPVYANPGILLLLYYTVATLVKLRWLDAKVRGCGAEPDPVQVPGVAALTAPALALGGVPSGGEVEGSGMPVAGGWLSMGTGHDPAAGCSELAPAPRREPRHRHSRRRGARRGSWWS